MVLWNICFPWSLPLAELLGTVKPPKFAKYHEFEQVRKDFGSL